MSAFTKAMGGGDPTVQAAVAHDVNRYMENAVEELGDKYAKGQGGKDKSVDGPTGQAYKEEAERKLKAKQQAKALRQQMEAENKENQLGDDEDADDDENAAMRSLREKRLQQMKMEQIEKLENIGKGHGQYREVVSDEFLAECCGSKVVIAHFYHDEFPRCKIIDHHLAKLAQRHVESKFVKINAAKAPFFVEKLSVRTMPTLCFFFDGVLSGKLVGFDGLADVMPEGKEDEWKTVSLARMLAEAKIINKDNIYDEDAAEEANRAKYEEMRKQQYTAAMQSLMLDDDEDDFSDVM